MLKGAISPKNIAGPIFILSEVAQSAKRGFEALLDFMIFLSVSLAILNLLPIPVLDGGHIVFFTIEASTWWASELKNSELRYSDRNVSFAAAHVICGGE